MSWREQAQCRTRPDLPWVADRPTPLQVHNMLAVCDACGVRSECRVDMEARNDMVGIRAGLRWVSETEPAKAKPAKPTSYTCQWCNAPFLPNTTGRPRVYCSQACTHKAIRENKRLSAQRRREAS